MPLTDDVAFQPNETPLARVRVNTSSIVSGPSRLVLGPTKTDLSKLNAYAVLNENGPNATKLVSYAVLITDGVDERASATDTIDSTYIPPAPWFEVGATLSPSSSASGASRHVAALSGPSATATIPPQPAPWGFDPQLASASIAVPRVNSGSTRLAGALTGPDGSASNSPPRELSASPWIEAARSSDIRSNFSAARLAGAVTGSGGSAAGGSIVANDPEQLSKLVGYAVLNSAAEDASKINAYAVLQGAPEVVETAAATDTVNGLYYEIIDPGPIEFASARDATNASFLTSGTAGPVRASQVVMEVLLPAAETARIKPFVWINT